MFEVKSCTIFDKEAMKKIMDSGDDISKTTFLFTCVGCGKQKKVTVSMRGPIAAKRIIRRVLDNDGKCYRCVQNARMEAFREKERTRDETMKNKIIGAVVRDVVVSCGEIKSIIIESPPSIFIARVPDAKKMKLTAECDYNCCCCDDCNAYLVVSDVKEGNPVDRQTLTSATAHSHS